MLRFRLIGPWILLSAFLMSGCGGGTTSSSPINPPEPSGLDQMKNSMSNQLKSKSYNRPGR